MCSLSEESVLFVSSAPCASTHDTISCTQIGSYKNYVYFPTRNYLNIRSHPFIRVHQIAINGINSCYVSVPLPESPFLFFNENQRNACFTIDIDAVEQGTLVLLGDQDNNLPHINYSPGWSSKLFSICSFNGQFLYQQTSTGPLGGEVLPISVSKFKQVFLFKIAQEHFLLAWTGGGEVVIYLYGSGTPFLVYSGNFPDLLSVSLTPPYVTMVAKKKITVCKFLLKKALAV